MAGLAVLAAVAWPTRKATLAAVVILLALVASLTLVESLILAYLQTGILFYRVLPIVYMTLLALAVTVILLAVRRARHVEHMMIPSSPAQH